MTLRLGTRIAGRYLIETKLAQGGMSAVFVAIDTKFERPVALKLAHPEGANYEDFRARFRREAMIGHMLGQLSTGFVRALDWGELEDHSLYMVMDLIHDARELNLVNGPRHDRLERLARAATLVTEVHALGIVHRDLKPANFLTSADGAIHLADFGLAKVVGQPDEVTTRDDGLGHLTSTGLALGTPYYMAPEQASAKDVDQRADVYPLGVMLFLALTGELPYQGSLPELLASQQRVLAGIETPPTARERDATVPPELDALCRRAMALDSARRLGTTRAFLDGLLPHVSRSAAARGARTTKGQTLRNTRKIDLDQAAAALGLGDAVERRPAPTDIPSAAPLTAPSLAPPTAAPQTVPPTYAPPPPPEGLRAVEGEPGVYENTRDGSILVWVPAGVFMPGLEDASEGVTRRALRAGHVYMGRYPVTWGQFMHFCQETGRAVPAPAFGVEEDHPVHNVSFEDARTYCAWAGLRLPTTVEWEFAARGEDGRVYPWGDDDPTPARCNWGEHPEHGRRSTTPVGSFPDGVSPAGCFDMAGNVLEWVSSTHDAAAQADDMRELRGGAWSLDAAFCRAARGVFLPGESHEGHVGFRVCRDGPADQSAIMRTRAASAPRAAEQNDVAPTRRLGAPRPEPAPPPQTAAPSLAPPPGRQSRRHQPPAPAFTTSLASSKAASLRQQEVLRALEDMLPWFGQGVVLKGREIKFIHEEAQVGLSLVLTDPLCRFAFLEQRVTFDPARLQGAPSGRSNLLLCANGVAFYSRGVRCAIGEDRLRFRREIILDPDGATPIEVDCLRHNADLLIQEWSFAFQAIKSAQEGMPWHEAIRPLAAPRVPGSEEAAAIVETRLVGEREVRRQAGGKLEIGEPGAAGAATSGADRVQLTCTDDEVAAEVIVQPWAPPLDEVMAIKQGEPAPTVATLLDELNELNHERPYALSWDPRRGVVARAHLTGAGIMPTAEQLGLFLGLIEESRRMEAIQSVG